MTGPADFGDLEEARTLRERLREKFPPEQVGKLPATNKRPALDYVGHAAVTDRLNRYAPDWTYTVDKLFNSGDATWIEGTITVGGVSRVEYGDGKTPKEAISDFVKRGAMRFGVALDLWSKEELATGAGDNVPDTAPVAPSTPVGTDFLPAPAGAPSSAAEAHIGEESGTTTSTAAETSDGEGRTDGGAPHRGTAPSSSGTSDTQETHIHGPWADAPRAGFVICQGTRNGKPCGYAEKSKNVPAEQVTA